MSYAQYIEELEYSESARYDRFDGFDRGDTNNPAADEYNNDEPVVVVIARQTHKESGLRLMLEEWRYTDGPWYCVFFEDDRNKCFYTGMDEREARRIGKLVLADIRV